MANAVIIKTRCQCENIDALNRKARNTSADLPNGTPVNLAWSAVEGDEVFTATVATSGLAFNIGRKEAITIASQNFLVGEQVDAWYLEVIGSRVPEHPYSRWQVSCRENTLACLAGFLPRRGERCRRRMSD